MARRALRILTPLAFLPLLAFLPPAPMARGESSEDSTEVSDLQTELPVEGQLVDFAEDVAPILESKCLRCHGPEEAKNGFRVDDPEWVLSYLEPGDLESSSLWTDYLVTDDPEMRMPPPSATGEDALDGPQLATIKLWIEEGAVWPEDATPKKPKVLVIEPLESMAKRLWNFQGLFHPASVHFPVALLSVSAGFVFLSFFRRDSFEPAAFHCLWIGAIGAIFACAMGWAYAEHEGYGSSFSLDLQNSAIDRHRWMGVAVAALSIALIPMAVSVRKRGDAGMRALWLLGSVLVLAAVGLTGYQGGELTYGEDHYVKEFQRLFPSVPAEPAEVIEGDETEEDEEEPAEDTAADESEPVEDAASVDDSEAEESESPEEERLPPVSEEAGEAAAAREYIPDE